MVMVLTFIGMLISGLSVSELNFSGNTGFGKEFECPVNGRVTDSGMFTSKLEIQLFNAYMPVGGEKAVEDNVALSC